MKAAPIILTDYFVIDLHVSANVKFDTKKESPIEFVDFKVECDAASDEKDERSWQLNLKLQLQPPAEANVPYRLSADMVGFVIVHPNVPKDHIKRLVETNGASMLFGALREIVRDATARGPFPALIIPGTSFYEPTDKEKKQAEIEDKKTGEK